jgi:hypothetical protein
MELSAKRIAMALAQKFGGDMGSVFLKTDEGAMMDEFCKINTVQESIKFSKIKL